jgi:hypothetical protein
MLSDTASASTLFAGDGSYCTVFDVTEVASSLADASCWLVPVAFWGLVLVAFEEPQPIWGYLGIWSTAAAVRKSPLATWEDRLAEGQPL